MFIQRIILIDYNLLCRTADSVLLAVSLGKMGEEEDMPIIKKRTSTPSVQSDQHLDLERDPTTDRWRERPEMYDLVLTQHY